MRKCDCDGGCNKGSTVVMYDSLAGEYEEIGSPKVVGWMCPVCGAINNPKAEECVKKCKGKIKNGSTKEANIIE